jgi:hypothetical protein
MANLNKTECGCMGFYDASGGCTPALMPEDPNYINPCPNNFWGTVGGWDWNAIGENALTWGYALGVFQAPNGATMENQAYMMELQRQKDQMMYIMIGLGITMMIVVLLVLRKK